MRPTAGEAARRVSFGVRWEEAGGALRLPSHLRAGSHQIADLTASMICHAQKTVISSSGISVSTPAASPSAFCSIVPQWRLNVAKKAPRKTSDAPSCTAAARFRRASDRGRAVSCMMPYCRAPSAITAPSIMVDTRKW